jgi:hypothetical protein
MKLLFLSYNILIFKIGEEILKRASHFDGLQQLYRDLESPIVCDWKIQKSSLLQGQKFKRLEYSLFKPKKCLDGPKNVPNLVRDNFLSACVENSRPR